MTMAIKIAPWMWQLSRPIVLRTGVGAIGLGQTRSGQAIPTRNIGCRDHSPPTAEPGSLRIPVPEV